MSFWRWRILSHRRLDFAHALRFGEAVRTAALHAWKRAGHGAFPRSFHDGSAWLAEDVGGSGAADHVLMRADCDVPAELTAVLAQPLRVWLGDTGDFDLAPVPVREESGWLVSARRWISASPYMTPKSCLRRSRSPLRADRTPLAQIENEIAARRLPTPTRLAFMCLSAPPEPGRRHNGQVYSMIGEVELVFSEPVRGPLALGHGAHLGAGLFRPVA